MKNETINQIAKKYSKTAAQVLLKWALQQNIGDFRFNSIRSEKYFKRNFLFSSCHSESGQIRTLESKH